MFGVVMLFMVLYLLLFGVEVVGMLLFLVGIFMMLIVVSGVVVSMWVGCWLD